jgi:hypothetical protein
VGYVYVMYYFAIITSVMMPHDHPGEMNRPCLRAGTSHVLLPLCFRNSNIVLCETLCNSRTYVTTHFYVGYVYVMYYFTIITSVMMPRGHPGEMNCTCLRVGTSHVLNRKHPHLTIKNISILFSNTIITPNQNELTLFNVGLKT